MSSSVLGPPLSARCFVKHPCLSSLLCFYNCSYLQMFIMVTRLFKRYNTMTDYIFKKWERATIPDSQLMNWDARVIHQTQNCTCKEELLRFQCPVRLQPNGCCIYIFFFNTQEWPVHGWGKRMNDAPRYSNIAWPQQPCVAIHWESINGQRVPVPLDSETQALAQRVRCRTSSGILSPRVTRRRRCRGRTGTKF